MDDLTEHVWLGPDGLVRLRALDGSDPTDWSSDEARALARALLACAAGATDRPSRPVNRNEQGVFTVADDGPSAFDCGGAIGVRAVAADGGPCTLSASEARQFAAALITLSDEYDSQ